MFFSLKIYQQKAIKEKLLMFSFLLSVDRFSMKRNIILQKYINCRFVILLTWWQAAHWEPPQWPIYLVN